MSHATLLLVRHGQSQANAGGPTLENKLVPLTPLGALQARTLAPLLPRTAAAIWSSPFKRALDTAAPYCERLDLSPDTYDDLREFEVIDTVQTLGSTFMERKTALMRFWLTAEPDLRTGPAAETFREFHDRVTRVRTGFLPSLPDGTVLFGHGMWMALLFWQLWGFDQVDHAAMLQFRHFQLGFPMPNAALYGITHLDCGTWALTAHEMAMRAVAPVGPGFDHRAHEDADSPEQIPV